MTKVRLLAREKRDIFKRLELMINAGVRWKIAFYRLWLVFSLDSRDKNKALCCFDIYVAHEKEINPVVYLSRWFSPSEVMLWELGLAQGRPLLGWPVLWIQLENRRSWLSDAWENFIHPPVFTQKESEVFRHVLLMFRNPREEDVNFFWPPFHFNILKVGDFKRNQIFYDWLLLNGIRESWASELSDYSGLGIFKEGWNYFCERERLLKVLRNN